MTTVDISIAILLNLCYHYYMKDKILNLIEKSNVGDRWCFMIRDCINELSEAGRKGQKNICIVFDNEEEGAKMRCYDRFIDYYNGGMIKDGFIQ